MCFSVVDRRGVLGTGPPILPGSWPPPCASSPTLATTSRIAGGRGPASVVLAQWGLVGVGWATVFSVVWVQNHGTLRKDGARGLTLHDQEPGPFQLMHGIKRTKQAREAVEALKEEEQSKIAEYLALTEDLFARKARKDWSKDALDLTTRVLMGNPELYTAWNYRRDILVNGIFSQSPPDVVNNMLTSDLTWTMSSLRHHPKIYWIWNHRRWCLENIPDTPVNDDGKGDHLSWKRAAWAKDLYVAEKMLDADARNFHAWDYRRYILASAPEQRLEADELAYTTQKIEANFSNFSAWHQRSKVLSALWARGEHDGLEVKEAEFELLKQAMYTDPNDQSIWLYHKWLMGPVPETSVLEREIGVIKELLEIEPDSKWCLESLVHYGMALRKVNPSSGAMNLEECDQMLEALQRIDPMRKRRYEDLLKQVE